MFLEDLEVFRAFVHAIDQIAHTPANTQTIRGPLRQQTTVSHRRLWPSHDTDAPGYWNLRCLAMRDAQA